jgi:hypothetical protein
MPQQPASSSSTSAPGIRSSSARLASVPTPAFSWQWPWKTIRRPASGESAAAAGRPRRWPRRAAPRRASPGRRRPPRRVARQQREVLVAQREQARRLDADDRRAAPRLGREAVDHRPRHAPRRPEQALGDARPPAAARALQAHAPPRALEQLDRRAADLGLGERRERVGQEDHVAAGGGRAAGRAPRVPAQQRVALEARQRALAGDPERALEQRPRARHARREIRYGRERRARPVQRADRPERPRAQRRAVDLLVVGQELALERRHVDVERTLAPARLALEAEVEDLVQALVAECGVRVGLRERPHERVRPAPGRVILLARGHVRRTHDAGARLAAQADVHAAVGRRPHPLGAVEVQRRAQRRGGRQRRVAQVVGHRPGVDDLARVEHTVRVEQALDLAHRLVDLVAEHPPVERAADEPVAMLGGVDPAVAEHHLGDLLRHLGHHVHPTRRAQVDERADVQAADRAVAVEAGLEAAVVEQRLHLGDVVVEPLGRHGRVLDEGERRREPRLAAMSNPSPALRTSRTAAWSAAFTARRVW